MPLGPGETDCEIAVAAGRSLFLPAHVTQKKPNKNDKKRGMAVASHIFLVLPANIAKIKEKKWGKHEVVVGQHKDRKNKSKLNYT